jgi:hypothetical protein
MLIIPEICAQKSFWFGFAERKTLYLGGPSGGIIIMAPPKEPSGAEEI